MEEVPQDNVLHFGVEFAGVIGLYSLISKDILLPLHHVTHLTIMMTVLLLVLAQFCISSIIIVSSMTRVNFSQFNAAILSHLRKLVSFNIINIKCGQLFMTMFAVILPK